MLTQEQIKNLKPGDPIVINGTVNKINEDGHILATCGGSAVWIDNPYYVSLPSDSQSSATAQLLRSRDGSTVNSQSKYDPTRLFRKGDRVQPRSGKTVLASEYGFVTFHELAGQYEVNEDEARGTVTLIVNGHACFVSAFALELVTPVEELEPYYIVENDIEFQVRMRYEDKDCLISVFRFKNIVEGYKQYYDMLPTMKQAREAAESECKRRNEEYRKEQGK